MEENGEQPRDNPFSPIRIEEASSTLESLRNRSLTIFNLSTTVSPLPGEDANLTNHSTNDYNDDDNERRYDLAHAIAKHAYTSRKRQDSKQKRIIYHLALLTYYKLLRLDFYSIGALESVLLLLSILGYDDHCLGLIQFVLEWLEDTPAERISISIPTAEPQHKSDKEGDETGLLKWVYGCLPNDTQTQSLEDILEIPEGHHWCDRLLVLERTQWCANAFLVPLLLVSLRKGEENKNENETKDERANDFLQQCAIIGSSIERECFGGDLPVLRCLLSGSNQEWDHQEARILLTRDGDIRSVSEISQKYPREPNRWEESCLLFWKILKDCVEDNEVMHRALQDTIAYMEESLQHPPAVLEQVPEKATSLMELLDAADNSNSQARKIYCLQCRQRLSCPSHNSVLKEGPPALRCSRCCAVHYCSRKCQTKNYSLHKERCKNIHSLRTSLSSEHSSHSNTNRYNLAYAMVDLAYVSTDTIDRGRKIYHLALVEYYKLLQSDFYYVGALESILILLSILGYDDHLLGLVDFVYYRLEHQQKISVCTNGKDNAILLDWAQGAKPPERKQLWTNLESISLLQDQQWSTNQFLLPLLFCSTKKQTLQRKEEKWSNCVRVSAELGRAIEEETSESMLPVLRGLLPDSIQRWGQDEASEVLAATSSNLGSDTDHWKESCLLFWEILKDAVAFTPRVADALEDTINAMERFLTVTAIPEVPQDLSEYTAWSGAMAEEIR